MIFKEIIYYFYREYEKIQEIGDPREAISCIGKLLLAEKHLFNLW